MSASQAPKIMEVRLARPAIPAGVEITYHAVLGDGRLCKPGHKTRAEALKCARWRAESGYGMEST